MKYLLLILIPINCLAWEPHNTAMEVAYAAANIADWGQTLDIARRCESTGIYETNPILGECPSAEAVSAYFLATIAIHPVISYMLPRKWREAYQVASIAYSVSFVQHNYRMGLKISF